MQQTQWNMSHIKQCETLAEQAVLSDEPSLVSFSTDFGHLLTAKPEAVFLPTDKAALQKIIQYAAANALPLTIRGNGLSQSGQSLPVSGGITVCTQMLNQVLEDHGDSIWVEANCSWSDLIDATLKKQRIPYVIPYNCNLSVAGVISAGGVGASSFKAGAVVAHVDALEVILADGSIEEVRTYSPLFHACLGGQGRFGVITKARMQLRPCGKRVKTFFLLYDDCAQWQQEMDLLKETAHYIEALCTPAVQGSKINTEGMRLPFAQWFYALQVSWEYDEIEPVLPKTIKPWKTVLTQSETIRDFLHRHDGRFEAMKSSGQWSMQHPWYECFVGSRQLFAELEQLLPTLPLHYATVVQVVPVKPMQQQGFFMLPDEKECCAIMILNAGLPELFIPSCLKTIQALDDRFLPKGGKRYLSGYLGDNITEDYWRRHFGSNYKQWINQKKHSDAKGLFCSLLHPTVE